ncbi:MFS transporter, PAT family, beta-lactamase induction signal transducer AmpG [Tistlia consotensis]|uniref:MFS transporter, PAT family, beta-lactamase induction signal transducer AmpG n=1 Tax=Tistlia consotensis USBA 355 TaxID=560819 RepID=A0A1Y6B6K6_9PROT|nr:MFS transporter [Tistlia consotensis]SME94772.1 MFS transporter, PAT family, beta-lactamase induction signal transducer AmpG [Tistlia consotensis USBA 355]SNR29546.1 MFS transporter, PAT family, beta-lactamase induction signal transducer AmpG [Tistlia consotensis]
MSAPRARRDWRQAMAVYGTRRMLAVLLMGYASGLPLLLGFSTLSYWMAKAGVDLTTIGLTLSIGTPYAFKFLWAPALDHLPLPFFTRRFGHRRGWLIAIQLALAGAIALVGQTNPVAAPLTTFLAALLMATLSATQDIVVDAYRIEVLDEAEQGAGAATTQAGYRIGMIVAGAGAIGLSDFLSWDLVYLIMAGMMLLGLLGSAIGPEPARPPRPAEFARKQGEALVLARLRYAVLDPFLDFMGRRGWLVILLFVLLYKYGDAVAGAMQNPFFHDLGYSGVEIAGVTKVFGVLATLAGVFAGGALVARLGILPALFVGGVLQAATNLLFAAQAAMHLDGVATLAVVVGADNFTGGLGSAAFVAYLSSLCNVAFTGTQYALLTSLMAFGRTLFATSSGWLAAELGWAGFYVSTLALAIPGLLLLLLLIRVYPPKPAAESSSTA